MKTFQEFLTEAYLILERKKYDDRAFEFDRRPREGIKIEYDSPRDVKGSHPDTPGYTRVHDPKSGVTYEINHYGPKSGIRPLPGDKAKQIHGHKPVHDVSFSHNKMGKLSKREQLKVVRGAKDLWKNHISHMIPSGHLVSNQPDENYDENRRNPDKNTRESIYKRYKFGKVDNRTGMQFSTKIGKSFHPIEPDK